MKKRDKDELAEVLLKSLKSKEYADSLNENLVSGSDFLYRRSEYPTLFYRIETNTGDKVLGSFSNGEFVESRVAVVYSEYHKMVIATISEDGCGGVLLSYNKAWKFQEVDCQIPKNHSGPLSKDQIEGFTSRWPTDTNAMRPEICKAWGISPKEDDFMVLAATIGHRTTMPGVIVPVNYRPGIWKRKDIYSKFLNVIRSFS